MQKRKRCLWAWSVLIAGAMFIIIGIARGEMDVVLRKAIMVCLECIGIG